MSRRADARLTLRPRNLTAPKASSISRRAHRLRRYAFYCKHGKDAFGRLSCFTRDDNQRSVSAAGENKRYHQRAIEEGVFSNWFTGSTYNQSLGASFGRAIQIPTSVVSIADGAFGGYSGGPGYPSGPSGSAGSLSPSVYYEGTAADFAQIELK